MYADTWLLEKSKTVNKSNFLAESNLYCALSQQSYPFFLLKKKTKNIQLLFKIIINMELLWDKDRTCEKKS